MDEQAVQMTANQKRDNEPVEIDLLRLWNALRRKFWMVIIATVLAGVLAFTYTMFAVTPLYRATALFYVNNSDLSVGDASFSISSGDISTSKSLVASYIVILNTRGTINDVIDYAGSDRSYGEVRGMISAAAVNETEIFAVDVTSTDPAEAESLANAIAHVIPKRIATIIEGSSAKVVDYAVQPSSPCSPSYTKNTMTGLMLGFFISALLIVLVEAFDVTIKEEEDLDRCCKYPVLASIPDMSSDNKKGRYYYRSSYKHSRYAYADKERGKGLIGSNIGFAASEAYKMLRTKIKYSFTDDNKCHVIAISSAMAGEGKSVSSANLAHTLAQFGERVLLIDCDMRRPTVAEKLGLSKSQGLSDYLTGTMEINGLLQRYSSKANDNVFYVMSAGPNPPNPMELLSSPKMETLMKSLRNLFDYIVLDLPPIGEVSDALVSARIADGLLLVVRQNYCNRIALKDAVWQFDSVGCKVLGVVVNCSYDDANSKYKYGKYKKYGYRYYRSNRYSRQYYRQAYGADRTVKDRAQRATQTDAKPDQKG